MPDSSVQTCSGVMAEITIHGVWIAEQENAYENKLVSDFEFPAAGISIFYNGVDVCFCSVFDRDGCSIWYEDGEGI